MKNKTQIQAVQDYLKSGKEITSLVAIQKFGATRLASLIHRLIRKGLAISKRNVIVKTRYGKAMVTAYKLK